MQRAPTRAAIFEKTAKIANIVKSVKNWKIRRVSQKLSKRRLRGPPTRATIFTKAAKIANTVTPVKAVETLG